MPKRPTMRDFHVVVRVNAEVSIRVAAANVEEAIAKGRDIQANYDGLLDQQAYDELQDGSAELVGAWTID